MSGLPSGPTTGAFTTSAWTRANVTLRQLQAFVVLSETESFTAAAKQMHLTQSALSALVRELESEVDARLFDRTTRSVNITAAGRDLLPVAQRVLRDLESGLGSVRDLGLKRKGIVTVAVTPMLAAGFMPGVCAAMRTQYPGLRVQVKDGLAAANLESVRRGEADLAIGNFGAVDDDIALTLIEGSRVGVVVHHAHRLAQRRQVRWRELAQEPLILLSRDSAFRQLVSQALLNAGVTQVPEYEVGYIGTALGLAQAALGVAICPSHVARTLDPKQAHFTPLTTPSIRDGVYMASLKGRTHSAAAQALVDVVQSGRPWPTLGGDAKT